MRERKRAQRERETEAKREHEQPPSSDTTSISHSIHSSHARRHTCRQSPAEMDEETQSEQEGGEENQRARPLREREEQTSPYVPLAHTRACVHGEETGEKRREGRRQSRGRSQGSGLPVRGGHGDAVTFPRGEHLQVAFCGTLSPTLSCLVLLTRATRA